MPLALDPQQTTRVNLTLDEKTPVEERPVFIVHFMTSRQRRLMRDKVEQATKAETDTQAEMLILDAIQIALCGWDHIKGADGNNIEYDPQKLPDVLTDLEMWELVGAILRQTRLSEIDLKNSCLPSDTDSAASVKTAEE